MTTKNLTAAERYRQQKANLPPVVVDVIVPSGFTFKFLKPSKFALLFGAGELPQAVASMAAEQWTKDGVLNLESMPAENQIQVANKAYEIRDRVFELSVEPKIVAGEPQNDNELSTNEIGDRDLEYLFAWVASGGEDAAMRVMFPDAFKGRESNALASASRKGNKNTV